MRQSAELSLNELLAKSEPWFEQGFVSNARFSGDRLEKLKQWLQDVALPKLKQSGEIGQEAWSYLTDPDTLLNKDRIAAIFLAFCVIAGWQNLDPSTATAVIVLLIKLKNPKG